MERVTTKIVWDISGRIIEHEWYWYDGPWGKLCGASSQQTQIEQAQANYYTTMTQQAQEVFGEASSIFKDLQSTFAPILAEGPNQLGFSPTELQTYENQVTNETGEAYHNASTALNAELATEGGGNVPVLSGADNELRKNLAQSSAQQESSERANITEEDYTLGRQNFNEAVSALSSAPSVFNPATGIATATTGAGSAASNTANEIAQENNSWENAAIGALGGVVGGIATGGMSNLGAGVGFFGQNAPAPGQG